MYPLPALQVRRSLPGRFHSALHNAKPPFLAGWLAAVDSATGGTSLGTTALLLDTTAATSAATEDALASVRWIQQC